MPRPSYFGNIMVDEHGRWVTTLEGEADGRDYASLDEAVDAIRSREALACARVPADRTRRYRDLMETAKRKGDDLHYAGYRLVIQELEAVALEICKRANPQPIESE